MTRRIRPLRPAVEPVESRLLTSGMAARPHHVALSGQVGGGYSPAPSNPDAGAVQTVHGSGQVRPLGQVQATGSFHATGFIAQGHASGTITLATSRGSITLALTGPSQPGFSRLPGSFTFRITAATGLYRGATDTGTASLTEVQAAGTSPSAIGTPIVGPIFGLTLTSR